MMNFHDQKRSSLSSRHPPRHVILSEAKNLRRWHAIRLARRSFASLRMTSSRHSYRFRLLIIIIGDVRDKSAPTMDAGGRYEYRKSGAWRGTRLCRRGEDFSGD